MSHKVLVVDDDPQILRTLRINLTAHGYRVALAPDGGAALRAAADQHPDVIVLDLGLPDMDGTEVIAGVRGWSSVPIIVLTARTGGAETVRALDSGADDYVTKPFGVGELIARVQALLRLVKRQAVSTPRGPILVGKAAVDLAAQMVAIGRKRESLTFYEAECLRILHGQAGHVVSRDELLQQVWGADGAPSSRTVDNVIVKLRRKLQDDAKKPKHILTVYGAGYKLVL